MTLTPAGYLGLAGLAAVGGLVGWGVGRLVSEKGSVTIPSAIVGAIVAPVGAYAAVQSVHIGVSGVPLPERPPIAILFGFPRARRA